LAHVANSPIRRSIFLALLILATRAWGQPEAMPVAPTVTADTSIETPAQALQADAAEYARTFNVEPAEALRRLQAQEASVPLVNRLADGYRDRLAGIIIEHQPIYRIVIAVTGAPAADTAVAIGPFSVPIVLRSGAVATRAQTLDAIERHQADIRAGLPSPPGMGVDPRTGALLVLVRPEDLANGDDAAATAARLEAIAGVPVEIRTGGDFDTNLAIEGGGRLIGTQNDSSHFLCTAGFVVTDGTRTALSTAAHCPYTLSFVDQDKSSIPLTMIGAWGANHQDVQLDSAGVPLPPLFYGDDESKARPVAGWRSRTSTRAGDVVCHRGQRSGYSCSIVLLVDYAPPGDLCAGPCPATWVAVGGPKCEHGDSGGPIFLGSTAFGLLKAESSENGRCKLYYYMSTDYLPPGWTLLSMPPPALPPD
jgi:hypothetical protein